MPDDLPLKVVEALAEDFKKPPPNPTEYNQGRWRIAWAERVLRALPAGVLVIGGQGNVTFSANTDEWKIEVCSRCGQINGEWICNCHRLGRSS
jgi:hypothetical protein